MTFGKLTQIQIIMKKNRIHLFILLSIIIIGLSLQFVTLFFAMEPDVLFWPDPKHYYEIASDLAKGEPYSTIETQENLYRSPGYPFILSLMMRIFGKSVMKLRLIHIALFPIFLFSLYKLGSLWKNQITGLICAFLGALYPLYVYTPLTLYPESFLLYLFPGIFILILKLKDKVHYNLLFLLSALITLAIMIRPTCVYLLVVVFLYLIWHRTLNGLHMKKLIVISILLSIMPMVSVSGWMVRNKVVHDRFLFSTAGLKNILMSYNENANWQSKNAPLPTSVREKILGAADDKKRNEIYIYEIKKFIKNHPFKVSYIAFMQCLDLWNPVPRTATKEGLARLRFKIILAISYVFFLILGFFVIIREKKDAFVKCLVITMIFNTVINGLMAVSVRYRLLTDFAFILPASFAVEKLLIRLRSRTILIKNKNRNNNP